MPKGRPGQAPGIASGEGLDEAAWRSLQGWCRDFGIPISPDLRAPLGTYQDLLRDWNTRVNLTAIRAPRGILIKHFFDSLTVLGSLAPDGPLLDIGTGGGFPGLVLKIARPALPVTLVEARARKVAFLEQVRRVLGLRDCTILHRHLVAGDPELAGRFSTVVSRAFREPGEFLRLAREFLSAGGRAVAMLGAAGPARGEAEALAHGMGGSLEDLRAFDLPEGAGRRHILVVAWPPG